MKTFYSIETIQVVKNQQFALNLRRMGISKLPKLSFDGLERLDLSYNAFKEWPINLPECSELDLCSNQIEVISFFPHHLCSLNLNGNPLKCFPEEFGTLEKLSLSGCGLFALPDPIVELEKLCFLDISDNNLNNLPQDFSKLKNLEFLDIMGNPLSSLIPLINLPKLKNLKIDFLASEECLKGVEILKNKGIEVEYRSAGYSLGSVVPIAEAVIKRDLGAVKQLANPDSIYVQTGYPQDSLLDLALECGSLPLVKYLWGMGVDKVYSSRYPRNHLHSACSYNADLSKDPTIWQERCKILEFLIDKKVNINAIDWAGYTPLHRAATYGMYSGWGRSDLIQVLVMAGANLNSNSTNKQETPLLLAIINGDFLSTETLLKLGADPNCNDARGATPIHIASNYGYTQICKLLQKYGANCTAKDNQGSSGLHYCALDEISNAMTIERKPLTVSYLIEQGIAPDAKDHYQNSALHIACKVGNRVSAKYLIKAGADPNSTGENAQVPLHTAIINNQISCIQLLSFVGNKSVDSKKNTALHLLAITNVKRKKDLANLFLLSGADPNNRNIDGDTPLHLACREPSINWALIGILLRFGAKIDIQNHAGVTPEVPFQLPFQVMHQAAWEGAIGRTASLIRAGFSINEQDSDGKTPLHFVNRLRMAKFLVSQGAYPFAKDNNGATPEQNARARRRFPAADWLASITV